MKKLGELVESIAQNIDIHKPELQTSIGLGCLITAVGLGIYATIAAERKLKETQGDIAICEVCGAELDGNDEEALREHAEMHIDQGVIEEYDDFDAYSFKFSKKAIIKTAAPYYISVAGLVIVGTFMVGKGLKTSMEMTGLYATAACELGKQLKERIAAENEILTDAKKSDIEAKTAEKKITRTKDAPAKGIIDTGRGTTLVYDYYSGRYFRDSIDDIKRGIDAANREAAYNLKRGIDTDRNGDLFYTLNQIYAQIDWPEAGLGDIFGFKYLQESLKDELIELSPTSVIVDGEPCYVVRFKNCPEFNRAF